MQSKIQEGQKISNFTDVFYFSKTYLYIYFLEIEVGDNPLLAFNFYQNGL